MTVWPIGEVPLVIALAGHAVLKATTGIADVVARTAPGPRRGLIFNTVSGGSISLAMEVTGPIADRAGAGVSAGVYGSAGSVGTALGGAASKQAQTSGKECWHPESDRMHSPQYNSDLACALVFIRARRVGRDARSATARSHSTCKHEAGTVAISTSGPWTWRKFNKYDVLAPDSGSGCRVHSDFATLEVCLFRGCSKPWLWAWPWCRLGCRPNHRYRLA